MGRRSFWVMGLVGWLCLSNVTSPSSGAEPSPREQAAQALKRAVGGFRKHVATEGGYLWTYSEDLSQRAGENLATATMVWVQPPGTPSVGLAYLQSFEATGDPYYRDAAREVAMALVRGQLRSGGWDYLIEFDPKLRSGYDYRVDTAKESQGGDKERGKRKPKRKKNVTTLDDNNTQEALRFLMRLDQTLGFKDQPIHEAVQYALEKLIEVQYPNGGWPQRFDAPPNPADYLVKQASYPASWSRTYPSKDYKAYYTLNDNALGDTIDVMLEAARIYKQPKYEAAAKRGGDFLLLAQMPEPQPAWAQQYDADMHPAWARKFEPPSITGLESQSAIKILMSLYEQTGESKYLETLPRAIAYLEKSRLPDGQLARFYELKTNTPLYFTKDYQLTESDADMPTHYGFKVGGSISQLSRRLEELKSKGPKPKGTDARQEKPRERRSTAGKALPSQIAEVIESLDPRGLWVVGARSRRPDASKVSGRTIDTRVVLKNLQVLNRYLQTTRP